jgi:hypothetical protein
LIIKKSLNVRQAEQLCRNIKQDGQISNKSSSDKSEAADLSYVAESLRNLLQTRVKISGRDEVTTKVRLLLPRLFIAEIALSKYSSK